MRTKVQEWRQTITRAHVTASNGQRLKGSMGPKVDFTSPGEHMIARVYQRHEHVDVIEDVPATKYLLFNC